MWLFQRNTVLRRCNLFAANIEKLQNTVKMDAQMKKDLDKQIDKFKEDLKKNRFTIHSLEKDRDR